MPQLDYASILRGGQDLVPNLREQMFADRQLAMQESQVDAQRKIIAAKALEATEAQRRQREFGEAMEYALHSGNPRDMQRVRMLFPEFTKDLKDGFDALDEDQRRTTMTQLGSVRARLAAGDVTGAREIVARRHEADKAAGVADEDTEELLALLDSGDPESIKLAQGTLTYMLASVDPDSFAETFGKLEPTDAKTSVQKEYEWRVEQFGQDDADQWLATQDVELVVGQPGAPIFDKRDFIRKGGDPASRGGGGIVATPEQEAQSEEMARRLGVEGVTVSDRSIAASGPAIEQAALAAVPGLTVTSRQRSTARNRAVGGVANSYHLTNQARDFIPPRGMAMGALWNRLKRALPGFDVINEGDHVHVEPAGQRSTGPTRIATKQQYDKLASGSAYIAPDGSHRVKP